MATSDYFMERLAMNRKGLNPGLAAFIEGDRLKDQLAQREKESQRTADTHMAQMDLQRELESMREGAAGTRQQAQIDLQREIHSKDFVHPDLLRAAGVTLPDNWTDPISSGVAATMINSTQRAGTAQDRIDAQMQMLESRLGARIGQGEKPPKYTAVTINGPEGPRQVMVNQNNPSDVVDVGGSIKGQPSPQANETARRNEANELLKVLGPVFLKNQKAGRTTPFSDIANSPELYSQTKRYAEVEGQLPANIAPPTQPGFMGKLSDTLFDWPSMGKMTNQQQSTNFNQLWNDLQAAKTTGAQRRNVAPPQTGGGGNIMPIPLPQDTTPRDNKGMPTPQAWNQLGGQGQGQSPTPSGPPSGFQLQRGNDGNMYYVNPTTKEFKPAPRGSM